MKKLILSLTLLFGSLLLFSTVNAAETVTGEVVIHFQKWDGDYTEIGRNMWGYSDTANGVKGPTALAAETKTDDFGIYWELGEITTDGTGTFGFQAVGFSNVGLENEDADWSKKYANHEIQNSIVKDGKTVHVYIFEGSNTRTNDEKDPDGKIDYLVADPDKNGVIITYYDSSGNYEENLGVHNWDWAVNASDWNVPLKIFVDAGKSSSGVMVKAGILYFDGDKAPGALVYYGDGDDSKKTGDIKPRNEDNAAYIKEEKPAGQLDVIYTVNKGSGNTSNNNVWVNDPETFAKEAFSFDLMGFKPAVGITSAEGTYAYNPKTVMVQTNQEIKNPVAAAETEAEKETARQTVTSWFAVREITSAEGAAEETFGEPLDIKAVSFAETNETFKDFVVELNDELDNTKRYRVFFDDLVEGDAARVASIELDIDRKGPELTFLGNLLGKAEAERIILVEWNKKFDQNLFPTFLVNDDRDGDRFDYVFVPSGEFSTLNTNIEGDYVIMLQVEDNWGNVTQEKFTFRVTRNLD